MTDSAKAGKHRRGGPSGAWCDLPAPGLQDAPRLLALADRPAAWDLVAAELGTA
jgi:hypothetical protein